MSDLVSRSALKKQFEAMLDNSTTLKMWSRSCGKTIAQILYDAITFCIEALDKAPAVDAVPVVRCRDCKWFKPYQKPVEDFDGRCVVHMYETDEEEYCSIGERKDDG